MPQIIRKITLEQKITRYQKSSNTPLLLETDDTLPWHSHFGQIHPFDSRVRAEFSEPEHIYVKIIARKNGKRIFDKIEKKKNLSIGSGLSIKPLCSNSVNLVNENYRRRVFLIIKFTISFSLYKNLYCVFPIVSHVLRWLFLDETSA